MSERKRSDELPSGKAAPSQPLDPFLPPKKPPAPSLKHRGRAAA